MEKAIKVMLVEDNREYRDVIQFALEGEAMMELLGPFATAEKALASFQQRGSMVLPDVVLLDLRLPGIGGLQALPLFRETVPNAKILVLSQSDSESDVLTAITLGASGYLLKSSTVKVVKEGIRAVVAGEASLDPFVAKYLVKTLKGNPLKVLNSTAMTTREIEVLELLADGLSKKMIGDNLSISYATVDAHVRHIYEKLEVKNAPAAVSKAYQLGIFTP